MAAAMRQTHARSPGANSLARLFGGVVVPVLILDQVSKYLIRTRLSLYESIAIIPQWFDITFTLNPGAAFSTFVNAPQWFRSAALMAVSSIAIVVLIYLLFRDPRWNLTSLALALILSGACGNLIDRVRFGRVVDFIDVHYGPHHYPIFNLADSAISIGVTVIIVLTFFGDSTSS